MQVAGPPLDQGERGAAPRGWWRRRRRIGLVALLPGLALAAVFVASPFSGTQVIDEPSPTPSVTHAYPPGTGSGR